MTQQQQQCAKQEAINCNRHKACLASDAQCAKHDQPTPGNPAVSREQQIIWQAASKHQACIKQCVNQVQLTPGDSAVQRHCRWQRNKWDFANKHHGHKKV
jgi:hypothetical protein